MSSVYQLDTTSVQGVALTQRAVSEHLGDIGEPLVSVVLVLFATTTIAYNSFLGENSIAYFERLGTKAIVIFRLSVLTMIAWASVQDLGTIFSFADLTMALLALTNLAALWALYPVAIALLSHFEQQINSGRVPNFSSDQLQVGAEGTESWPPRLQD